MSFNANSYPGAWGKGYGELQIIAHALKHSRLIGPETRIVKVTGRYYVRNVGAIIREISTSSKVDVFCDLRSNLTWGESRIFCASGKFLDKFLLPMLPIINESEGILFEHALGRAVHGCMADGGRWSLLPEAPIIVGVDGTTCIPLANSFLGIFTNRVFRRLKQMTLARS